jgi:hypothetical protein
LSEQANKTFASKHSNMASIIMTDLASYKAVLSTQYWKALPLRFGKSATGETACDEEEAQVAAAKCRSGLV